MNEMKVEEEEKEEEEKGSGSYEVFARVRRSASPRSQTDVEMHSSLGSTGFKQGTKLISAAKAI